MDDDLLTKEEIARELATGGETLSTRSVERYIQLANESLPDDGKIKPAENKRGGKGKIAKYRRADVEKIKAVYRLAQAKRDESQALTTTKPALPAVVLVEELQASNQRLSSVLDPWPIWMNRTDAIERTGLPSTWFDAGVRSGELKHVGQGRARRFHRDHLRQFAERVGNADYLSQILNHKARKA